MSTRPLRLVSPRLLRALSHRLAVRASSSSASTATADAPTAPTTPATQRKMRVLSGVQPTGTIHLGNYLGAMKQWVNLQSTYDTYYCVVDLHAITAPHDPLALRQSTLTSAALYLASGIHPTQSTIFIQSHVPAHAELSWLLNCVTPIGWLERMIQYKEKARKQGQEVNLGLLSYPVLMAADILLYQADLVPVGEDQRQHLELTRDIAERFNHLYGGKKWKKLGGRGGRVFRVPDAMINKEGGARIMSLSDGSSKMSKSSPDDASRINLLDAPDLIASKIKRAKTDLEEGLSFDDPNRPEATNLLTIYQIVASKTKEEVLNECGSMRWGQFKPLLTDALIAHLQPLQERYREVRGDEAELERVLARGAEAASEVANKTLADAYESMGYLPRRGLRP